MLSTFLLFQSNHCINNQYRKKKAATAYTAKSNHRINFLRDVVIQIQSIFGLLKAKRPAVPHDKTGRP